MEHWALIGPVLRRECVIAEITWFRHLSAEIASYHAFSAAAILPKSRYFGSRHLAAITVLRQKIARFPRLVGATGILWDSWALWHIAHCNKSFVEALLNACMLKLFHLFIYFYLFIYLFIYLLFVLFIVCRENWYLSGKGWHPNITINMFRKKKSIAYHIWHINKFW